MQGAPALYARAGDDDDLRGHEPLVEIAITDRRDLDRVVSRLGALAAAHRPFVLLITGTGDLERWQEMLWQSPGARARLRRMRSTLGTWCAGTAHLVDHHAEGAEGAARRRFAELCWGCRTEPFTDRAAAVAWLAERLEDR